ncbi:MAG: hypothetical protein AAB289_05725 [Chloroflexota bacterium]
MPSLAPLFSSVEMAHDDLLGRAAVRADAVFEGPLGLAGHVEVAQQVPGDAAWSAVF